MNLIRIRIFLPELPYFKKNTVTGKNGFRSGAKGERRRSVDTYMNSMSSTIENGLQRQAALPHLLLHFLPHFHRIFTEFNSPKIKNFEF